MYKIENDRAAGRITVTFAGFISLADFAQFTAELMSQVRSIRLLGKHQTILYNYSDASIQSQEVITAVRSFATTNQLNSKRVALYSAGRLANMQAKRIAEGISHYRVFSDRTAAVAWLDEA